MNEDYEAINLANSANERRKQYNKSQIERMETKPLRNSLKEEDIKYEKKRKKQRRKGITRVVTALVITATLITAGVKIVQAMHNFTNYGTFENPTSNKGKVDITINKYYKLMNDHKSKDTRIETVVGSNTPDRYDDPYVDYLDSDINNFADYMIDSSNISEEEFRCAVFAATQVINEPYTSNVFNNSVRKALSKEDKDSAELSAYVSGDKNYDSNFLEKLGYKNWIEYRENERENIANLMEINQRIEESNKGKGM